MKKKRPWDQSYSGKVRRKTPPQRCPPMEPTKATLKFVRSMRYAKTRRVFVTLELETNIPLLELRKADRWERGSIIPARVLQAQANVARPEK